MKSPRAIGVQLNKLKSVTEKCSKVTVPLHSKRSKIRMPIQFPISYDVRMDADCAVPLVKSLTHSPKPLSGQQPAQVRVQLANFAQSSFQWADMTAWRLYDDIALREFAKFCRLGVKIRKEQEAAGKEHTPHSAGSSIELVVVRVYRMAVKMLKGAPAELFN